MKDLLTIDHFFGKHTVEMYLKLLGIKYPQPLLAGIYEFDKMNKEIIFLKPFKGQHEGIWMQELASMCMPVVNDCKFDDYSWMKMNMDDIKKIGIPKYYDNIYDNYCPTRHGSYSAEHEFRPNNLNDYKWWWDVNYNKQGTEWNNAFGTKVVIPSGLLFYFNAACEFFHSKDQHGGKMIDDDTKEGYRLFVDGSGYLKCIEMDRNVDDVWYFRSIDDIVDTLKHFSPESMHDLWSPLFDEIFESVDNTSDSMVETRIGTFNDQRYADYLIALANKMIVVGDDFSSDYLRNVIINLFDFDCTECTKVVYREGSWSGVYGRDNNRYDDWVAEYNNNEGDSCYKIDNNEISRKIMQ